MKAEVNEKDVVKHWGLYNKDTDEWLTSSDGIIFAVTCPRVANAQLDILTAATEDWPEDEIPEMEVREIE